MRPWLTGIRHLTAFAGPAIIKDEVLIALMDAEMARDMGYRISGVAHDLAVTRKELAKRNFDAVLLDISRADTTRKSQTIFWK